MQAKVIQRNNSLGSSQGFAGLPLLRCSTRYKMFQFGRSNFRNQDKKLIKCIFMACDSKRQDLLQSARRALLANRYN